MLNRRRFLTNAATAAAATLWVSKGGMQARAEEAGNGSPWRRFEIITKVDLQPAEGPAQLWLPVVRSAGDYQKADAPLWVSNSTDIRMEKDPSSGADILRVMWEDEPRRVIEVTQHVATRDRRVTSKIAATEAELQHELRGTPSMPVDGIVKTTAMRIVEGRDRAEDRARAIYDWVIDNTFRDANIDGCGVGNARDMLETGYFGGKCADISSLFVSLARAAGLPARDVFGIRVADSADFKSLGRSATSPKRSTVAPKSISTLMAGFRSIRLMSARSCSKKICRSIIPPSALSAKKLTATGK